MNKNLIQPTNNVGFQTFCKHRNTSWVFKPSWVCKFINCCYSCTIDITICAVQACYDVESRSEDYDNDNYDVMMMIMTIKVIMMVRKTRSIVFNDDEIMIFSMIKKVMIMMMIHHIWLINHHHQHHVHHLYEHAYNINIYIT